MKRRIMTILSVVGCLSAMATIAQVYKQVNPDGTVVYTDKPDPKTSKEEVQIQPTPTIPSIDTRILNTPSQYGKQKQPIADFSITIGSPVAQRTYNNGEANAIAYSVGITPEVSGAYKTVITVDNTPIDLNSPTLPFQYRGEHTFEVKVLHKKTGKVAAIKSVVFYVQRYSGG